jgi:N utilization substance protein B
MKRLFASSFQPEINFTALELDDFASHAERIDATIRHCAPEWPLTQINRVDLAILRLALYELITQDTPYKVIIDEAVELAKQYGSDSSAKFINGVLGCALKQIHD